VQGIAYALLGDCILSDGEFLNTGLSTYIVHSVKDVPDEVITTILEIPSSLGPYGAKGIAEIVTVRQLQQS
jgi:CO/xanthine dehydrogenase Mo-binding subunit